MIPCCTYLSTHIADIASIQLLKTLFLSFHSTRLLSRLRMSAKIWLLPAKMSSSGTSATFSWMKLNCSSCSNLPFTRGTESTNLRASKS